MRDSQPTRLTSATTNLPEVEPSELSGIESLGSGDVMASDLMEPGAAPPRPPAGRAGPIPRATPASSVAAAGSGSGSGPAVGLGRRLNPGDKVNKYQIIRELGRGAMGIVYEAEDPLLARRVAIKILAENLSNDPAAMKRFLSEAKAAGKLYHPNAIAIYDVNTLADGTCYLVLELVRGRSTDGVLKENGPFDWREATRIIAEVCRGLDAAHRAGLVHRDIKPANIMLADDSSVKVADFGLAKSTNKGAESLSSVGKVVGTPQYMSPEQCQMEPVDARSDIYSVGATYYALLTGEPPFGRNIAVVQLMFAHCTAPIPDPRKRNEDIPEAVTAIIQRAMAKAPADRYQTAHQMVQDLEGLVRTSSTVIDPLAAIAQARAQQVLSGTALGMPSPVTSSMGTRLGGSSDMIKPANNLAVFAAGMTPPGMAQPSMTPPGVTQAGMTYPGMTQAGMTQPGMTYPGMTQPGMTYPGMIPPGSGSDTVPAYRRGAAAAKGRGELGFPLWLGFAVSFGLVGLLLVVWLALRNGSDKEKDKSPTDKPPADKAHPVRDQPNRDEPNRDEPTRDDSRDASSRRDGTPPLGDGAVAKVPTKIDPVVPPIKTDPAPKPDVPTFGNAPRMLFAFVDETRQLLTRPVTGLAFGHGTSPAQLLYGSGNVVMGFELRDDRSQPFLGLPTLAPARPIGVTANGKVVALLADKFLFLVWPGTAGAKITLVPLPYLQPPGQALLGSDGLTVLVWGKTVGGVLPNFQDGDHIMVRVTIAGIGDSAQSQFEKMPHPPVLAQALPNCRHILLTDADNFYLSEVPGIGKQYLTGQRHTKSPPKHLAVSADGRVGLLVLENNRQIVFGIEEQPKLLLRDLATIGQTREPAITAVAVSPTGDFWVFAKDNNIISLVAVRNPSMGRSWQLPDEVTSLAISPDGRFLAAAYKRGGGAVWDLSGVRP